MTIYEVKISAEDRDQADTILNALLDAQLVTGGQFVAAPARFWWQGEIVDMAEYLTITSYTLEPYKDAICESVRQSSQEEVPMITFLPVETNPGLHDWVVESLANTEVVD